MDSKRVAVMHMAYAWHVVVTVNIALPVAAGICPHQPPRARCASLPRLVFIPVTRSPTGCDEPARPEQMMPAASQSFVKVFFGKMSASLSQLV